MKKLLVLGDVAHTSVVTRYAAGLAAVGVDWEAMPCVVETGEQVQAIMALDTWDAMIVMPPYQTVVRVLADKAESKAQAAGGANVVVRGEDGIMAFNATGVATVAYLVRNGIMPAGKQTAVLGTGVAARAVVTSLSPAGVAKCAMFSTDKQRCITAAQATVGGVFAQTYEDGAPFLVNAEIVIDTTGAGDVDEMVPGTLDALALGASQVVVNASADGSESAFVAAAKAAGCTVLDGVDLSYARDVLSLQTMLAAAREKGISYDDAFAAMVGADAE